MDNFYIDVAKLRRKPPSVLARKLKTNNATAKAIIAELKTIDDSSGLSEVLSVIFRHIEGA